MKKETKNNIRFVIVLVLIAGIVGLVCSTIYSLKPPGKEEMEKFFNKDRELLEMVVCYLEKSGCDSVYIHKNMIVDGIEDETVVKAIDQLFKRGYKGVTKDGNTISFLRWTRLMDFGSGIAYSINEVDDPVLQYLTKLDPLSEKRWYYYEEDYNESRR